VRKVKSEPALLKGIACYRTAAEKDSRVTAHSTYGVIDDGNFIREAKKGISGIAKQRVYSRAIMPSQFIAYIRYSEQMPRRTTLCGRGKRSR
jgi:hypothetical protein